MYGYECPACLTFWSCQAAPGQRFEAITRWCPDCLAFRLPVADLPPLRVHIDGERLPTYV